MVKYGKRARLGTMLVMTSVFFVAEIVTGYLTNSMALVADSFHMLSDALSIVIGLLAVIYSERDNDRNTYGGIRAEVLGAMANSVFLMALVFTIVVGAIQRLIVVEPITKPLVILGVGGAGLLINLVGLLIFGTHTHGHDHSHPHSQDEAKPEDSDEAARNRLESDGSGIGESDSVAKMQEIVTVGDIVLTAGNHDSPVNRQDKEDSSGQMNMQAVFLHVLGDALGSVVVIISALIIYFVEAEWRYYIDPLMSLLISVIISCTTIPLLRKASMILLQNPPPNIDVKEVGCKVLKVPGVISVHDFHVWQLTGSCVIATIHVVLDERTDFNNVARQLKKIFHGFNIHATTIQPEFISLKNKTPASIEGASERTNYCRNCATIPGFECGNRCSQLPERAQGKIINRSQSLPQTSAQSEEFIWEENSQPEACLLSCMSDNCKPYMCCKGAGPRKRSKKAKNSYVNPSYVEDRNHSGAVGSEDVVDEEFQSFA